MKILYSTAVFLLLTFFNHSFAQQKIEISFFGGVSLPQGDYGSKDWSNDNAIYAMIGGSSGISVTKYLNSNLGIGGNLAANFNSVDAEEREWSTGNPFNANYEINEYFNVTFTPYLKLQTQVHRTSLYLQAGYGIGYYKSPRHIYYSNHSASSLDYEAKGTIHHQAYAAVGMSYRISPKTQIGAQVQGYHSSPTFDLNTIFTSYIDGFIEEYGYKYSPKITTINPQLVVILDMGKKIETQ
ncbi:MAG: hypothetical protein R3E32_23815 [Chitinophagales bacterium]